MSRAVRLAAVAMAGLCGPAFAHAFLETAAPAAGENLKVPPAAVRLHFSERLEPAFSGIAVTDESGRDDTAAPSIAYGMDMSVALQHLPPGRYRVSWHAVSVDTHRTEGRYNFLVLP